MSAVVDTNILVYDTFEDTRFYEYARRLLDDLEEWVIPLIVVYEYVWVLRELGVDLVDVEDKLKDYVLNPKARVVPEDLDCILEAFYRIREENLGLSRLNDKVILLLAKKLDYSLATFDKKLRNQARKMDVEVLPRYYPARGK